MGEDATDPFASLLQEVASSASPAPSDGGTPGAAAAGQPSSKADGGAQPGAQATSTANPGTPAPDQGGKPGEENRTADGQPAADGKGSLPEHLKPFETTLKAKGWDLSKPEGITKVLTSFTEAESNLGRRTSEANLLHTRTQEVERDFREGVPGINRRLEAMGIQKLDVQSPQEKFQQLQGVFNHVNALLNPQVTDAQRAESLQKLNELVTDPMRKLEIQIAAGTVKSEDFKAQRKTHINNAVALFNQRVGANPALEKAYDQVLPLFQPGGVFHSLGLDEFTITSSPERAQAMERIGQALDFHSSAFNADGTVKEGGPIDVEVKKALQLAGQHANAAPAGGTPNGAPPPSNGQLDPVDAVLRTLALEHR